MNRKNKKEENNYENSQKINIVNNLHEHDIYVHKKKNSAFGIEQKKNFGYDMDLKKSTNFHHKYNVTINNINNCNYFSLIQTSIRPVKKIK